MSSNINLKKVQKKIIRLRLSILHSSENDLVLLNALATMEICQRGLEDKVLKMIDYIEKETK